MGRHVWRGLIVLVALAGCGPTLYPVTNGSYRSLPLQGTPVVVWGPQDAALTGTESWLEHRGLVIVPRAKVRETAKLPESGDMPQLISAASAAGAKMIVFVESGAVPSFPVSVSIRGIAAPGGEELWQAAAWYTARPDGEATDLELLACQALATVWGFRPAGYHEVPSSNMCALDETRPTGHPTGRYSELG